MGYSNTLSWTDLDKNDSIIRGDLLIHLGFK